MKLAHGVTQRVICSIILWEGRPDSQTRPTIQPTSHTRTHTCTHCSLFLAHSFAPAYLIHTTFFFSSLPCLTQFFLLSFLPHQCFLFLGALTSPFFLHTTVFSFKLIHSSNILVLSYTNCSSLSCSTYSLRYTPHTQLYYSSLILTSPTPCFTCYPL